MGQGSAGNIIAAVCSFFISGLGQLVQGRLLRAAFFFIGAWACYAVAVAMPALFPLIFLGFIIQIWSIIDAATFTRS